MNGFREFLENSDSFQASYTGVLPRTLRRFQWVGWWLFLVVMLGTSACSTEETTASFGTRLEVSQSSCQPAEESWRDQVSEDEATEGKGSKVEEVTLVRGINGPEVQASLWFNCAVGEICAEEKRDEATSSLDILFFPCQLISESVAKCMCMIDVQSPVNVEGVSSIRVFKQALGRPSEPIERDIIAEIEIGPQ